MKLFAIVTNSVVYHGLANMILKFEPELHKEHSNGKNLKCNCDKPKSELKIWNSKEALYSLSQYLTQSISKQTGYQSRQAWTCDPLQLPSFNEQKRFHEPSE